MPEGFPYDSYKDTNGVVWKIYATNRLVFAYTPTDQGVRYRETPTDLQASRPSNGGNSPEDREADVASFSRLRKLIDEYAQDHRGEVELVVTASRSGGILLLIGVIAAAYYLDR